MAHIAAYGTLRVGHHNFNRFNLTPVEKDVIVKGFDLYDLGPYPCIVENPNGKIIVDILECSENTLLGIRNMEIGAGYDYKKININGIECEIYFFDDIPQHAKKITNGDYNRK